MFYELVPIVILLVLLLIAGVALIGDATFRILKSIQASLRDRRR